MFKKFIEFNEKKLIRNNNLSTYKSFDEVEKQVAISELNNIDKNLEKQILRLYETDEWLIIKPLSWQASKKYGFGTKWCTTLEEDSSYFNKYYQGGLLIYTINKYTGDKIATYKTTAQFEKEELSFWNAKDERIDSIQANLPSEIMDVIRQQILTCKVSNFDLLIKEQKENKIIKLMPRLDNFELEETIDLIQVETEKEDLEYDTIGMKFSRDLANMIDNQILENIRNLENTINNIPRA